MLDIDDDAPTDQPLQAISGIILAGGRSSRMGRDKATTLLRGRTLLARTIEAVERVPGIAEGVLVLAPMQAPPEFGSRLPVVVARDRTEGEGPLAGIAAGMSAASAPLYLVLGCDTPFVRPALLELLATRARDHPFVLPLHGGRPQPLCSAIRRDALATIEALLAAGTRAPSALADDPRSLLLERAEWLPADPDAVSFIGVNTPEELAAAERLAARLDE